MAVPLTAALGCAGKPIAIAQPAQTVDTALGALRKKLKKHVADEQRRERAMAKLDQLGEVLVEFDHIAYDWRTDSHVALVANADRATLIAIADTMNARVREQLVRAAEIGIGLREDILETEWPLVFPTPAPAKTKKSKKSESSVSESTEQVPS